LKKGFNGKYFMKYLNNNSYFNNLKYKRWVDFFLTLKKNGVFLDVGCGLGKLLAKAEKFYLTYGCDLSDFALKKARKISKNSILYKQDLNKLFIFKKKFDLIIAFDIYEHLKNDDLFLREASQHLKSDGFFVLKTPNLLSISKKIKGKRWFAYKDKTYINLKRPDLIKRNLRRYFEIIKVGTDLHWDLRIFKPIWFILGLSKLFHRWAFGENIIFICQKK